MRSAEETRWAAERARRLSVAARRNDVRPAYMLAGILSAGNNTATRALVQAGVDVPTLIRQLRAVPGPPAPAGNGPDLAYSRRGVAVLSYAMRYAHARGDREVTTLHVLMGIAECSVDPAARLLRRVRVDSLKIEGMIDRQFKGPAAIVFADQAVFVFPAPKSLQPCSYRRSREPHLRLYSWTVDIGGPGQGEWYAVNVWPAVPDSGDAGAAPSLAAILRAARPHVATVGGEPPMSTGMLDTTHVEAHAVAGEVVVRLTRRATIARLFAKRPATVLLAACQDGNDRWHREVPVRYEP